MTARRYPLEPLFVLMRMSPNKALESLGVGGTMQRRYRAEGVTERVADRLAVKAGYLPHEVWPELTDDNIADAHIPCAECDTPFLPTNARHRYCSRNCASRHNKRKRYHEDPAVRARILDRKRTYNAQCADYQAAAERRRYWADPERQRARKRNERAQDHSTSTSPSHQGAA